jgi:hypothetical protein
VDISRDISCLISLLKIILYRGDGKYAPEWKGEPFAKRTDIDLEMEIQIIRKYEVG